MKRIAALTLCIFSLFTFSLTGCNSTKTKETFSISDIDLIVEEKIFEGENTVVFSFQNNTNFTIIGIDIEFKQKENLSDNEISILNKYSVYEEDLSNIYISANNYYFTKSGEKSNIVPCSLIGSWDYCHNMKEYNIMEASEMSIAYIKDNKMFGVQYNFKNKKTISLSENGQDLYFWTETDASNLIPKPNKQVV